MTPVRHPPGWYRDPGAPGLARRWDGRAWTADPRPAPPWLTTGLRLAPGPTRVRRGRARRSAAGGMFTHPLWITSMAFALLALAALVIARFPSTSPGPIVADRDWRRGAAEACSTGQDG